MNRIDINTYMEGIFKTAVETHKKKSHDYSNEIDVLSNFKRLSEVAKTMNIDVKTPQGYALFMILLKMDRINNLIENNKTPNNESIDDTILDMTVYTILMGACIKDNIEFGEW